MNKRREAELRELNFPPTVQARREALCVAVELSQTIFIRQKPRNARTSNQIVSESQTAKTVCAASCADLVCWGPLKLHIILVFIIFSRGATGWTQGLFVSVCLLCHSTPSLHPHLHSSLLSTFGTELPLLLKNTIVSMVPFFFCARPFGQKRLLGWGDVCHPHENLCLFSLKATLHCHTAHFAARISTVISPCHDRDAHLLLKFSDGVIVFVCWWKLKLDGWMVITGQSCW